MIKYWICSADGGLTTYIVGANHKPVGAIIEAPKDPVTGELEDIAWLVIQDSTDSNGNTIKVAVVDSAAKKAKVKADKDKKKADKDTKDADDAAIAGLKQYLLDFDKSELANLSDIQDAIDSIIQFIKLTKKL